MLVHIKEIVTRAQKGKYALGAFNTPNLEVTLGIVRAAAKKKAPVIIQISEATIKYAGLKVIRDLIKSVAENEAKTIPIAIHLDHGKSFELVAACVDAGVSSVHMDGSDLPFEKNIAITKKAAAYAHRRGVWLQGELGSLFGKEGMTRVKLPKDPDVYMTDPAKAAEFVKRSGVDTLAVSVGTMHGCFVGKEKIDFVRLAAIGKKVKLPLVLHGASGVEDRQLAAAVKKGVTIVNLDTILRIAFTATLKTTLTADQSFHLTQAKSFVWEKKKHFYDPRKILAPSIEAVQKAVEQKIEVLGGKNRV